MSSARFMLDTNTVIRIRSRIAAFLDRFETLQPGEAVVSAITYGELRFGAEKSEFGAKAQALLARLIAAIPVEPLTSAAASEYGGIRLHLERRGEIIGPNDLWIAAHARALGLTLVTSNEREFGRVPGLVVENWAT